MATRPQHGGRPGGARFAQFKLVLLGMLLDVRGDKELRLTTCRRVGGRKELPCTQIRQSKTQHRMSIRRSRRY